MSENPEQGGTRAERARVTSGDTQYDYVDNTATENPVTPHMARGSEATQATVNPAFYPKSAKPEALHNEAEKAGAEFPGGSSRQAAMMRGSKEELDAKDPKVANPAAPAAPLTQRGMTRDEQSTGTGQRETTRKSTKTTKSNGDSEDSAKSDK